MAMATLQEQHLEQRIDRVQQQAGFVAIASQGRLKRVHTVMAGHGYQLFHWLFNYGMTNISYKWG